MPSPRGTLRFSLASSRSKNLAAFPRVATTLSAPEPGSITPIQALLNLPSSTAIRHASWYSSAREPTLTISALIPLSTAYTRVSRSMRLN